MIDISEDDVFILNQGITLPPPKSARFTFFTINLRRLGRSLSLKKDVPLSHCAIGAPITRVNTKMWLIQH